jgi:hypothetical protein
MTSLNVLSRASKVNRCAIGASSQIISFVCFKRPALSSLCSISHVELSKVGTGILNFEWAVLPPGSRSEAIPLDATVITISDCDLKEEAKVRHMNVLPVPT